MSRKGRRGQLLNRTEMADHLGISMPTLDDWIRRGCPVVERGGRGKAWSFNSAEVREWRDDDIRSQASGAVNSSIEDLKKRKLAAETEQAELDLSRDRNELVPVEQYQRALIKAFGEVRAGMRNVVPGRAVRRLIGEADETRFKEVLLEEIDHALAALADMDLIHEEDIAQTEEDEEAKGGR
ncbi:terminase small subunit [Sulfitobacter sp. AS92]|uniref:terminase small subunit n=1 Tax=Sulfitobacter sp. AS92 TaxID=3135783 RepID=UPI00317F2EEF